MRRSPLLFLLLLVACFGDSSPDATPTATSAPTATATAAPTASPIPTPPPTTSPTITPLPTATPLLDLSTIPVPTIALTVPVQVEVAPGFILSDTVNAWLDLQIAPDGSISGNLQMAQQPQAAPKVPSPDATRAAYFPDDFRPRCIETVPTSAEGAENGDMLCRVSADADISAEISEDEIIALARRHRCPNIDDMVQSGIVGLVRAESEMQQYAMSGSATGYLQLEYQWFYRYWRDFNVALEDVFDADNQFRIGCWLMRSDLRAHSDALLQWRAVSTRPRSTATPLPFVPTPPFPTPTATTTPVPVGTQTTAPLPTETATPSPTATTDCPQPDATMPGNQQQILIHACQVEQVTGCTAVERGTAPLFGWRCLEWGGVSVSTVPMTRNDVLAWVPVDPSSAEANEFADKMIAIMQCSTGGHRGWISGTAREFGAIPVHESNYADGEFPFTSDAVNILAAWQQYERGELWRWPWNCHE